MTTGGDLRRPAPPSPVARELAAAPEHEGHERTGVTVYVALRDSTEEWHAEVGGRHVQVTSTALATWRMRTVLPPRDPSWTPLALGLADAAAPSLGDVTGGFAAGRLLRGGRSGTVAGHRPSSAAVRSAADRGVYRAA